MRRQGRCRVRRARSGLIGISRGPSVHNSAQSIRPPGIDARERRADRSPAAADRPRGTSLFGCGRRPQGLVIDDQHPLGGRRPAGRSGRTGAWPPIKPDHRHLGLRVGAPQRGEIRVVQHRQGLAADLVLLARRRGRAPAAPENAAPRARAPPTGSSGRLCSSRCTSSPRLKRSRPALASGDSVGGSAPLGRDGSERLRRVGLGRRRRVAQSRQRAGARARRRRPLARRRARSARRSSRRPCAAPAVALADQRPRIERERRRRFSASPALAQRVPGIAACGRLLASASRRYRAGPAPGSARRRAGADIPAAARSRNASSFGGVERRCEIARAGTTAAAPRARSTAARPAGSGSCIVSGRNTIGASSPLAPCTVRMRTSSRCRSPKSRLTSMSPATSQCRKPCSDGTCSRS